MNDLGEKKKSIGEMPFGLFQLSEVTTEKGFFRCWSDLSLLSSFCLPFLCSYLHFFSVLLSFPYILPFYTLLWLMEQLMERFREK